MSMLFKNSNLMVQTNNESHSQNNFVLQIQALSRSAFGPDLYGHLAILTFY